MRGFIFIFVLRENVIRLCNICPENCDHFNSHFHKQSNKITTNLNAKPFENAPPVPLTCFLCLKAYCLLEFELLKTIWQSDQAQFRVQNAAAIRSKIQ